MISRMTAAERGAWREVPHGWRQLYGDFDRLGVSVEWHDFRTERALDWGRSFHPRSVEFCLNLEGRGAVGAANAAQATMCRAAPAITRSATSRLPASRQARTIIISLSLWNFRESICKSNWQTAKPISNRRLRACDFSGERTKASSRTPRPMSAEQRNVVATLAATAGGRKPPRFSGIRAKRSS